MSKPITFEEGSVAWMPDPIEVFVPVRIVKAFEQGGPEGGQLVKLRAVNSQTEKSLPTRTLTPVNGSGGSGRFRINNNLVPTGVAFSFSSTETLNLIRVADESSLESTADMTTLSEISEATMLHNLRVRFAQNQVYTAIGSLLVSVNPFHALPLYTPEMVDKFRLAGSVTERKQLGPHVYAMSHLAFSNLITDHRNQSCIVSGESGSGKTEFAKLFLQYLMEVSKTEVQQQAAATGEEENVKMSLATRILTATQVLEAFGNASTARNDNSSRHGKWLAVKFHNKRGTVLGADVQTYLLEKSRLVDCTRGPHERNFHVFYQMLAGAENDWALEESLQLKGGIEAFQYLASAGAGSSANDDSRAFEETIRALRVLGMNGEEEGQLLSVLAGLLHLGNISFSTQGDDAAQVANLDVTAVASELLGLDLETLISTLTKKDLSNAREILFQNRTCSQAAEARDALAKQIYSLVFDHVVSVIRRALVVSEDDMVAPSARSEIGILDIFGFEVFTTNSFEQLLINYANEALQEKFFNRFLFESEKAEYIAQGMSSTEVDVLCAHSSTIECLKMFEDRITGMFSSLEDEIFIPQSTDATFLSRFTKSATLAQYKCFAKTPGAISLAFKIQHYAGPVAYDATGFLEKSKDRVDPSIENLILSGQGLLGEISKTAAIAVAAAASTLSKTSTPTKTRSGTALLQMAGAAGHKTLGTKFVAELGGLIDALGQTHPHFARCIKPNDKRSPTEFSSVMVMEQLRYSGLLDVCRVRRSGFPVRIRFEDFAWMYACLLPSPSSANAECISREIFTLAVSPKDGYFGKDLVLLRESARNELDFQRETKLKTKVALIQKIVRGRQARTQMARTRENLNVLAELVQRASTERDAMEMDRLLNELDGISPFNPTVSKTRAVKLGIERRALVLNAIDKTESAQEAIIVKREALASGIKETDPVLHKINTLLQQKTDTAKYKTQIEDAMETRDLSTLERALSSVEFTPELTVDAEALRDRLRREHVALDALESAMRADTQERGRMEKLRTSLHTVMQMGMETHPSALAGMKLLKQWKRSENESRDMSAFKLQGTEDAKRALAAVKTATDNKDVKALAEARHQALELGLDRRADVQKAGRLLKTLDARTEQEVQLDVATDILLAKAQLKSGTALTARDVEIHTEVMYIAKQWQTSHDSPAMLRAQKAANDSRAQLKNQTNLVNALMEKDFDRIRDLLVDSARIGVDNDLIRRAKAVSSNRDGGENGARLGRTSTAKDRATEINALSERDFEKKRMERLLEARKDEHDWWDLEKKGILRSAESFATKKGGFINHVNKRALKTQLQWSGEVIPKCMTLACGKSQDRLCKRAVLMNKAILGYCRDLVLPYPSVLAQQILEAALLDPPLQDELWVQLMKQLTLNPFPDSERRAWMLCCITATCVGPSTEVVENAVLNFLAFQIQLTDPKYQDPLHREFARYALRKFESVVINGPSGKIPTEEEIEAFSLRPPMLASIALPDGSELTRDMPVPPDTTVGEVIETCCETYGVAVQNAFMFGLFKELDVNNATERRTRRIKRMDTATGLEVLSALPGSGAAAAVPEKPAVKPRAQPRLSMLGSQLRRPSLLQRMSQSISKVTRRGSTVAQPPVATFETEEDNDVSVFQQEQNSQVLPERTTKRRASILSSSQANRSSAGSTYIVASSKAKLKTTEGMPARSPAPLTQDEYLGDVLAKHVASGQHQLVFIFRRTLVYATGEEPARAMVKDKGAYTSICYLDAVEEILCGNWACMTQQQVARFAALMIAELRKGQVPSTISPALADYVLTFVPSEWHDACTPEEWSQIIIKELKRICAVNGRECRRALLAEAQSQLPTFGHIPFRVRRIDALQGLEQDLIFACSVQGIFLHSTTLSRLPTVFHMPHQRVKRVGATAESCTIQIWNEAHTDVGETVVLVTAQGHELAAMLWEFGIKIQA